MPTFRPELYRSNINPQSSAKMIVGGFSQFARLDQVQQRTDLAREKYEEAKARQAEYDEAIRASYMDGQQLDQEQQGGPLEQIDFGGPTVPLPEQEESQADAMMEVASMSPAQSRAVDHDRAMQEVIKNNPDIPAEAIQAIEKQWQAEEEQRQDEEDQQALTQYLEGYVGRGVITPEEAQSYQQSYQAGRTANSVAKEVEEKYDLKIKQRVADKKWGGPKAQKLDERIEDLPDSWVKDRIQMEYEAHMDEDSGAELRMKRSPQQFEAQMYDWMSKAKDEHNERYPQPEGFQTTADQPRTAPPNVEQQPTESPEKQAVAVEAFRVSRELASGAITPREGFMRIAQAMMLDHTTTSADFDKLAIDLGVKPEDVADDVLAAIAKVEREKKAKERAEEFDIDAMKDPLYRGPR